MKSLILIFFAITMIPLIGCDDPDDPETGILVFGTDSIADSTDSTDSTARDTNSETGTETANETDTDSLSVSDTESDAQPLTCEDFSACMTMGFGGYVCPDANPDRSCQVVSACGESAVMCVTFEEACILQECTYNTCISLDTDPPVITCGSI